MSVVIYLHYLTKSQNLLPWKIIFLRNQRNVNCSGLIKFLAKKNLIDLFTENLIYTIQTKIHKFQPSWNVTIEKQRHMNC